MPLKRGGLKEVPKELSAPVPKMPDISKAQTKPAVENVVKKEEPIFDKAPEKPIGQGASVSKQAPRQKPIKKPEAVEKESRAIEAVFSLTKGMKEKFEKLRSSYGIGEDDLIQMFKARLHQEFRERAENLTFSELPTVADTKTKSDISIRIRNASVTEQEMEAARRIVDPLNVLKDQTVLSAMYQRILNGLLESKLEK